MKRLSKALMGAALVGSLALPAAADRVRLPEIRTTSQEYLLLAQVSPECEQRIEGKDWDLDIRKVGSGVELLASLKTPFELLVPSDDGQLLPLRLRLVHWERGYSDIGFPPEIGRTATGLVIDPGQDVKHISSAALRIKTEFGEGSLSGTLVVVPSFELPILSLEPLSIREQATQALGLGPDFTVDERPIRVTVASETGESSVEFPGASWYDTVFGAESKILAMSRSETRDCRGQQPTWLPSSSSVTWNTPATSA